MMKNIKKPLKDVKKELVFSELSSLLSSGLDFARAFTLLIENESEPQHRRLLKQMYAGIVDGQAMWQAMKASDVFTALDCGVVKVGEQTGRLGESLRFLHEYYARRITQRRTVLTAVRYPITILATAFIVTAFMLVCIVPMFENVYARFGGELPAITRSIIRFSRSFPIVITVIIIVSTACILPFLVHKDNGTLQHIKSIMRLNMPIFGKIVKCDIQAQICRILYLQTSSGMPLLTGIEMLEEVIDDWQYKQSFHKIADGLNKGNLLSEGMQTFPGLYDRVLISLLRVGEETNRLPQMLSKQADDLTSKLDYNLSRTGSILEPILIIFIGLLVAIILISMYLPMFRLGNVMM